MAKDKIIESYVYVYGWKVIDGKCAPPVQSYPLPDFVQKRIDWVSDQFKNGLTFRGAFKFLLDIDNEEILKKDWEFGALGDYLPVSEEYRKWLEDPILEDVRRVAIMVAVIYS